MFVPGSNPKKIQKALNVHSDVLIYDLEDAVAIREKESTRNIVKQTLKNYTDKISFVRVNGVSTSYFREDIYEIVTDGLAGIVLPKTETREEVDLLDQLLNELESKRNIKSKIEIIPMIESAIGLFNAFEIASSSKRIKRMMLGSVDLALDIDAELTDEGTELLYARSHLVIASRAAGIESPIDAVFLDINDNGGLIKETQFVKKLGFKGKLIIHPNQIDTVNQIFLPTKFEIEEARHIILEYNKALEQGAGVVEVNGRMVDYPVVERAKKIIKTIQVLNT
jgi:citrate lyase subunit beta/citryl-CoA lyase